MPITDIIGSRLALRNALDHRNTIVEGIRQIAAEHSSPHALAALRSATVGFDPLLLNLANTRRHWPFLTRLVVGDIQQPLWFAVLLSLRC